MYFIKSFCHFLLGFNLPVNQYIGKQTNSVKQQKKNPKKIFKILLFKYVWIIFLFAFNSLINDSRKNNEIWIDEFEQFKNGDDKV